MNGMPMIVLRWYCSYLSLKNCLSKYSSYAMRCEKNFQETIVYMITQRGLQRMSCVPTDQ